jgi:hypothetical protein
MTKRTEFFTGYPRVRIGLLFLLGVLAVPGFAVGVNSMCHALGSLVSVQSALNQVGVHPTPDVRPLPHRVELG